MNFAQGELIRQQLEAGGGVFQLVAQASQRIADDFGVVEGEVGEAIHGEPARLASVAAALGAERRIRRDQGEICHRHHPPTRVACRVAIGIKLL